MNFLRLSSLMHTVICSVQNIMQHTNLILNGVYSYSGCRHLFPLAAFSDLTSVSLLSGSYLYIYELKVLFWPNQSRDCWNSGKLTRTVLVDFYSDSVKFD